MAQQWWVCNHWSGGHCEKTEDGMQLKKDRLKTHYGKHHSDNDLQNWKNLVQFVTDDIARKHLYRRAYERQYRKLMGREHERSRTSRNPPAAVALNPIPPTIPQGTLITSTIPQGTTAATTAQPQQVPAPQPMAQIAAAALDEMEIDGDENTDGEEDDESVNDPDREPEDDFMSDGEGSYTEESREAEDQNGQTTTIATAKQQWPDTEKRYKTKSSCQLCSAEY